VFLPFGTITSIFGTQFFTPGSQHMDINPDFWVLWVIAIPVTLIILAVWRVTERDRARLWRPGRSSLHAGRSLTLVSPRDRNHRSSKGSSMVDGTELRDIPSHHIV
jgi:hypothetical protein